MKSLFSLSTSVSLMLSLLCGRACADTFTVTNTLELGDGSLVWAVSQAVSIVGADTVEFAIPITDPGYDAGTGVWEIFFQSNSIPDITDDSTFIDGESQRRNIGDTNPDGLEIELLGPYPYPAEVPPIVIKSAFNKIVGFSIGRFRAHHFWIVGEDAHHNVIQNNHIGVDADGLKAFYGKWNNGINIRDGAHHNLIGGFLPEQKNILGGFWYEAIEIVTSAHHNGIYGNYIGVNRDGLSEVGVGWDQYHMAVDKLQLDIPPSQSMWASIYIRVGAYANEIGSAIAGGGNVICFSGSHAIELNNPDTDDNMIFGNYIGVGADGRTACPNRECGIKITMPSNKTAGPTGTIIGGEAEGAGNVISGNLNNGILIWGNIQGTQITGNIIGRSADQSQAVPNLGVGVKLEPIAALHFPSGNVIGPGNTIAFNKNTGIVISGGLSVGNTMTRNSIYRNENGAIDLQGGANSDPPVVWIQSVVERTVRGLCFVPYGTVELFADDADQAEIFLASVKADAAGNFNWTGDMPRALVKATVTDADGNTSVLSQGRSVPVELAGFEAYPVGDGVRLEWHTLSEAKNLGFAVERRGETGEFEQIGFVDGAGTSVSPRGYEFFDTPPQGFVSYRLRQMDTDGAFSYSPVITVHAGRPERYDLSQPFPNPFNNRVSVRLNVPEDSFVTFEVINVRGEVVKTVHTGLLERGNHLLRWQGDTDSGFSAPSGLYFMRLRTPSGEEWRKIALVR